MATSASTVVSFPEIQHMHWCPTKGEGGQRVEQHVAYVDNEAGKSVPAKRVTRCQDCGECRYDDL